MAWKIERTRKLWKPWEYELIISSHGMAWGRTWTKRGAEKRLIHTQSGWFTE